jgi:transposase
MDVASLFTLAMGMTPPWKVVEVKFDEGRRRLDLRVDFPAGSRFGCVECGEASPVHDAPEQEWRHLNFFEHQTYVRGRQPRVKCKKHGVKQVTVPWARPGSGFTLLFEAFVVSLVQNGMPVAAVARVVGEHDTRLWRVLEAYVELGLARLDLSGMTKLGVDETSRARGHNYLTLFVDPQKPRVVDIEVGRDATTLAKFRDKLVERGGDPEKISDVTLDMSPAFIKGVREYFPNARMTFDKFHVIALANEAVDQVRREEQNALPRGEKRGLKDGRFLFLHNAQNLTEIQKERFAAVAAIAKKTARAWRYREQLQEMYRQPDLQAARLWAKRWIAGAVRSRLKPIIRVARTVREHIDGILRRFDSKLTNALLEGFSSLVQSAKAAARGYRSAYYMSLVVYLRLGKLNLSWKHTTQALPI